MTPRDLQQLHAVRQRREQQAASASALQRQACAAAQAALADARDEAETLRQALQQRADRLNASALAAALPVPQWLAAQAEVEAQRERYLASLEAVEAARQARSQQREHQLERDRELRRCQRRLQAWDSLLGRARQAAWRAEECHDEQEQGERPWSFQEVTR